MIRKFNYTGRRKIPKTAVAFTRTEYRGVAGFNATFDLSNLGFPPEARVYVEPYYNASFMRFGFGTVDKPVYDGDTSLTGIPPTDVIHFRVKIVDESGEHGLILGKIDGITLVNSEGETNRTSILHVNTCDLGEQIWRMNFESGNTFPVLEVNSDIPGIKEIIKNDPKFFSLVYPAALREILWNIVTDHQDFETDGDSWQSKWLLFCEKTLGIKTILEKDIESELLQQWINDVVDSFCRIYKVKKLFMTN